MGTGTLLDGEGHERVNSGLSRGVGMTRVATHESRQLDIALMIEDHNDRKIQSFPARVTGQLANVQQMLMKLRQDPQISNSPLQRYIHPDNCGCGTGISVNINACGTATEQL